MNIVEREMLQRNSQLAGYADHGSAVPHLGSEGITFEFAVDFVRRGLLVIVFSTLFMTSLGVAYFVLVPSPYVAVATLAIDTRRFQLFQQPANLGEQLIDSSAAVESQLEILKSENVALKVIKDLRLADDPEFGKNTAIPIISSLFASMNDSETTRTRNALLNFSKDLKVKRLGIAYIIEISFESTNAARAAQIANAIAEAYITDQLDAKYEATRQGSKWLEGRLSELRDQVAVAQRAIIDYKAKNNIVEAGQGRLVSEQQLTELNSQVTVARAKISETRARLDRMRMILSEDTSDDAIVNAGGDIVNNNSLITRLRTQYLEAASREREWSEKYGRNHLAAVNLRNNMRAMRDAIKSELVRIEESFKNDYQFASEMEKNLEKRLQQASVQSQVSSEAQVTLRELETSAQAYKTLYDNFMRRYTEAIEQQSFLYTEARLITRAAPPAHRTYRKTLLIIALTPLAGLFFGVGIAAIREFLDRGFRTILQVESMLGVNCLALIPAQKGDRAKTWWAKQMTAGGIFSQNQNSHDQITAFKVIDQPFSQTAEAIRSVKLAIDLNKEITANKVIGLTSSVPDEGKTTIAAALAQSIAQVGARVILVDCDFRNPSLSRAIAPSATSGILHVLADTVSLEEAMWTDPSTSMAFLPAVVKLQVANSSEILASTTMKKLFDKLRQSYDYIIVDLPPLAPLVDVRATTHLIDCYVFVIEWGRTYTAVAKHALSRAPNFREKLLGVVLNKVDMKLLSLYEGDRANYYDNKSYGRYGYTS